MGDEPTEEEKPGQDLADECQEAGPSAKKGRGKKGGKRSASTDESLTIDSFARPQEKPCVLPLSQLVQCLGFMQHEQYMADTRYIESMASAMLKGKVKNPGPHREFAKVTKDEFERFYRSEWIQR